MKKILPVFLAIIIFFTSTLMQVNKAQAVGQLAVPLAAGTGAGYAAVGAYVIGGLLIAGGAAYVLDDEESAAKIRQHSLSVWNGFDEATRTAWKAAIDSSIAAGSTTLKLTDGMITDIENSTTKIAQGANTIASYLSVKLKGGTESSTARISGYPNHFGDVYSTGQYVVMVGGSVGSLLQVNADTCSSCNNGNYGYYLDIALVGLKSGPAISDFKMYSDPPPAVYNMFKWARTVEQFQNAVATLGLGFPVVRAADSLLPKQDYFNTAVDQALSGLRGAKEVTLDMEKWMPKSKTGQALKTDTTGAVTLTDGTPYTGDIVWEHPKLGVPAIPKADAPSVPLENVTVGDTTFIPDTTAPPATGDTGILQGLWDWLKGILQKILDAILALASLVGIIAIIEKISSLIESLSQSVTSWKDAPTKKIDWSRLAVAAGTLTTVFPFSIPWDVFRLFNVLNVQPITPKFEISTNKNINIAGANIPIKYDFDVDFSIFNPIAAIGRWALVLIFDIAIIMALRRLTPD